MLYGLLGEQMDTNSKQRKKMKDSNLLNIYVAKTLAEYRINAVFYKSIHYKEVKMLKIIITIVIV